MDIHMDIQAKDIHNFFNNQKEADTSALAASATDDVLQSELLIVKKKNSTQVKKPRITIVPEKIKIEIGTYTLIHETIAVLERFNNIRTSISNLKFRIKKIKEGKLFFSWKGRPNLL